MNRRLTMRYTKEERLEIGRRIYVGELSSYEASQAYGVNVYTARDYMRLYRDAHHLPPKLRTSRTYAAVTRQIATLPDGAIPAPPAPTGLAQLEAMSKEELVQQVIQFRINELRLKKCYEVKGDGTVTLYERKNTK